MTCTPSIEQETFEDFGQLSQSREAYAGAFLGKIASSELVVPQELSSQALKNHLHTQDTYKKALADIGFMAVFDRLDYEYGLEIPTVLPEQVLRSGVFTTRDVLESEAQTRWVIYNQVLSDNNRQPLLLAQDEQAAALLPGYSPARVEGSWRNFLEAHRGGWKNSAHAGHAAYKAIKHSLHRQLAAEERELTSRLKAPLY